MVRLYASRTDPHDAYDPALSTYQSAKQALVANIARGRSWTGMTIHEEREDRLVEVVVAGEVEPIVNLILTLRYHGVGCLHAEADTPDELARLEEEFSGFAALEIELAG